MMSPEVRTNPPSHRRLNQPPTTVLLARRLSAPPERVFDAWLDPQKISKWMVAASEEDQIKRVAVDPRVGGTFSFVVVRQGQAIEHLGGYVEIERPRRLAFTWNAVTQRESVGPKSTGAGANGTLVTLDFAPAGTGTELRLTHEGVPEELALRTEEGWSKLIQALAHTLGP
jgi:uncharacterized protein YndB with AHSA1/START domain